MPLGLPPPGGSAHPDIKVISRDRGADYARAASAGAPQAVQVADRWHIVHNLTEAASLVLEQYRAQLRSVSQVLVPPQGEEPGKEHKENATPEGPLAPLPVASGPP